MNEFVASNDRKIRVSPATGYIEITPIADPVRGVDAFDAAALREFFRAEEDERLGRWRWPENPDYVVYVDNGDALVVSESDPRRSPDRISRSYCEDPKGTLGWGEFAARAYFDAHPEPKPWHDAEPGEIWRFATPHQQRHAIAWAANDGTWDVIDPRGGSLRAVEDPIGALAAAGYEEFADATGTRFVPEVSA